RKASLPRHQFGKIERETLLVVEAKSESAGNCRRSFRSLALKQLDSLVESLVETLFLAAQRFFDLGQLPAQFGKDIGHRANEHVTQIEKKRFVESQSPAVAYSPAQDTPKNVSAAFVARLNSVGDREAERADVIGDNAESDVNLFLFFPGEHTRLGCSIRRLSGCRRRGAASGPRGRVRSQIRRIGQCAGVLLSAQLF